MNSTSQVKLSPVEGKIRGWKLRQEDTGWGRVLLQSYVPFYWLYYAFSRRTITPWLFACGISFAAAFSIGLVNSDKSGDELDVLGTVAALVAAPFGYKAGTDKARKFAAEKLEQ